MNFRGTKLAGNSRTMSYNIYSMNQQRILIKKQLLPNVTTEQNRFFENYAGLANKGTICIFPFCHLTIYFLINFTIQI